MNNIFTTTVRVRSSDCDSFGHVNNSVYILYLREATYEVLGVTGKENAWWEAVNLAVEYLVPATYGDLLEIKSWSLGVDNENLLLGYRVTRPRDGVAVLSATILWIYVDKTSKRKLPVPDRMCNLPVSAEPSPLKPFRVPADSGAKPFYWRHRVRRYELDSSGTVGLGVYFNWLEAAFFNSVEQGGWPVERLWESDFISFQYRHDIEFFDRAGDGDEIEISSRLVEVKRVRGTWLQEIYRVRDRALIARDYSTGAFVDWQGKIRTAPAGLMERLVQGENPI